MPRVHSQAKQKNKPFKGKSNTKKYQSKVALTKTKHISKKVAAKRAKIHKNELLKSKKMRKINFVEKLTNQNQHLDKQTKQFLAEKIKAQTQIKVVLLLPCNSDADSKSLIKQIYNSVNTESMLVKNSETEMNCFKMFDSFSMFPISSKSHLKSKIQFIAPSRDIDQLIDLAKYADIICPILSCRSTNTKGMNLDPYVEGKAFDETGYTILNMLRSFGTPTTIPIIQHIGQHQSKHHEKIIRLFKRFFLSELGDEQKILPLFNYSDLGKLVRIIDSINLQKQPWKNQRGYMLVQNFAKNQQGDLVLSGFLKGNCINSNQLIHITGLDDFQIESIEIKKSQGKPSKVKTSVLAQQEQLPLIQYATNPQSLFPFAQCLNNIIVKQDYELLSALEGLKFQSENKKQLELQQNSDQNFEDISDQKDMEEDSFDEDEIFGDKNQLKAKRLSMQMRKEDQLQFQDQVQYSVQDVLREKFKNCQGLKNFKTSQWNHLENLPEEYEKVFTFKNYNKTQTLAAAECISKAFAYPGFFISVVVKKLWEKQQQLKKIIAKGPLIGSFLLKHERKMTMLHARVKRNPYYPLNDTQIESNKTYLITMGFRRFYVKPIFSRCIHGTQKTKYTKKIREDYENYYFCSFYYYNYFPPAPFSVYRVNQLNTEQHEPSPLMYGELVKCDPLHIILERIILCGYPFKINRRRCTVRYMFFNPKDVKFFKPIEVKTKMGLRGRIEESLGTHGLMKVFFNDQIKQNDTICMNLYNRVYPQANF